MRTEQLAQPEVVAGAYAASVRAQVAILTVLNTQVDTMQGQVEAHFGQHPDAEVYFSQPGLGVVLGAQVLAEFGDDATRLRQREGPQELRRQSVTNPAGARRRR